MNNEYANSQDHQGDAGTFRTNAEVEWCRGVDMPIPNQAVGAGNVHKLQHIRII